MSCFRLPKTITTKLTSAVAQYWWSPNGERRGMHWVAWEKLCRDKQDGGLGFRTIEDFNTALLAKQLWRLMEYPDSLFAKVLKGRYYRKSNPMESGTSYSPSYGWKSIISARPLVQKGLIKRVGAGSTISVWKDPWIPAQPPRAATCKTINYYPSFMVNHLIDPWTRTWNMPLINAIIVPEDVDIIRTIPIGSISLPDSISWAHTQSGKYTVKSGYYLEHTSRFIYQQSIFGPSVRTLQAQAWKLRCPQKLRHFLWQTITGCLPVSANLYKRGIQCDTQCSRCGMEETINHALFECPPALQAWALSNIPTRPGVFPVAGIYTNMDYLFWRIPQGILKGPVPWITWYIWKARNGKMFQGLDTDPNTVIRNATAEALAWETAQSEGDSGNRATPEPVQPAIHYQGQKCYIDGSWKNTDHASGIGWFSFQTNDTGILMGARNTRRSLSPLHSETEALVWAMQCMIQQQKMEVAFATDCSDLVQMVSTPQDWPAFAAYLEEIQRLKNLLSFFSLSLIPRTQNSKADRLANDARRATHNVNFVSPTPPAWITDW